MSTLPRLATISRLAKDRLVETLLAGLADQLIYDTPPALDGLIVAPAPSDYWIVDDPQLTELMLHSNVAVVISQVAATSYDMRLSGTGTIASMIVSVPIAVSILVGPPHGYPSIMARGRELVEREIRELIVDIYRAAAMDVLMRDAVDGRDIIEIRPSVDYADAVTSDTLGTLGRAVVEYTVRAQGVHPSPSYALTRELP